MPRKIALGLLALILNTTAHGEIWGYVIGEQRTGQQANFCDTEAAVDELAAIFRRFGAQTGFSALASSPDCAMMVQNFVPLTLKHAIKINLESGDFYTINTIRVQLQDGQIRYLITTRNLRPAD